VGLLYRAADTTRLGLAWTAPVAYTVPLDMRANGLHPVLSTLVPRTAAGELRFTLPQQLTLGTTTQVTPTTLVGIEVGRQDWSTFGHSTMTLMGQPIRILPDGLRDTWNVAAGFRHQLDPAWNISAGVAYDSSPAKRSNVPAYFPVAEQWRFSTGVERRFSDGMVVRAALSVIDTGDARISQEGVAWPLPGAGDLSGTVSGSRAYVFCVASDFAM
jgi:long-chain fatty acid transport protein